MPNKTHWKAVSDPNYFGTYAFNEQRNDIIDMVVSVTKETVTNPEGREDSKLVAELKYGLPLILNVTNSKMMEKLCQSPYIEEWSNCWVSLYITKVKAFGGGDKVDGVRIRSTIPMLTEKHPMWQKVTESIASGKRTVESIKTTFKTNETADKKLASFVPTK